jgi:fatty acid desaturase
MRERRDEPSLGELFSDLARETSTLVRQEVELAKTEMTQKASRAGKDVAMMAVGGAVIYAGFLALLAALIAGIVAAGLAPWLSALIVGVAVVAVGGALVWQGREALRRVNLAPRQTIHTLKEDAAWVKQQAP